MTSLSIVFFGTPKFATRPLEALLRHSYTIKAVVTKKASPVELYAKQNNLRVLHDAENAPDADIFIIAAYGKILPKTVIEKPQYGTLNIHPSLLPLHRGPSPVAAAILSGDKKTGITIMLTDIEMDHGPILAQKELTLDGLETSLVLTKKLFDAGTDLLLETIPKWIAGDIRAREQNHAAATFSKIVKKEYGLIDWREPAETVERKIRAYNPWPTAWSTFIHNSKKTRVSILEAKLMQEPCNGKNPGYAEMRQKKLFVTTGDKLLEITKIQPESRTAIAGEEFARGYMRDSKNASFV